MFNPSSNEIQELLVSTGNVIIEEGSIRFINYPFQPSVAFKDASFKAKEIEDVDISFFPTVRIKNELVFVTAQKKEELKNFALQHQIKLVKRPRLWDMILEPFLDTEFTPQTEQKIFELLEKYGLRSEEVKAIRAEVSEQMIKYNFGTMLWEWVSLDAVDVLRAMRTKYSPAEFKQFYNRVMEIALREKI